MINPSRRLNRFVSILLSLTLVALSPGKGLEVLAVAFTTPKGGIKVTPRAGNTVTHIPRLRLNSPGNNAAFKGLKPSLSSPVQPSPVPTGSLVSEASPLALPTPDASLPAVIPGEQKTDLQGIAAEIQPDLQAASELSETPAESAPGIGRRIINALFRRGSTPEPRETTADPVAVPNAVEIAPTPSLSRRPSRKTEAILKEMTDNPPAAVILDYDGTLTGRDDRGLSTLPTDEMVAAIVDLLKAGTPVGIATGRTLDFSPNEERIPMAVWKTLIERIPAEHRKGLFFSGRIGSEFVRFDAQGQVIRIFDQDWSTREKRSIRASLRAAMRTSKISKKDLTLIEVPSLTNVVFPTGDKRMARFARELKKEFRKRNIRVPIHESHEWIFFSRTDKADGLRMMFTSMKEAGYPVALDTLLFVGDNFATPKKGNPGGDASGALAFPLSRALTVGDRYDVRLPGNVRRLGIKADAGTLAVLRAVLKGKQTPQTLAEPEDDGVASEAEMEEFYRSERQRSYRAAAITLPLALMPLLWTMAGPAAFAIAGSVILTFIGIPQIIKNFRDGPKGTKGLAPASTMIWFGASVLLTVTSLLRGASVWWLASNAAGVLQALIILAQLNAHRKDASLAKTSALVVGGMLALAAPMLLAVGLTGAAWAALAFNAAMSLLFVLNWPQIRKNYQIYKQDGTVPSAIAWQYMAMVVAGSLLTGITAAMTGDLFWLANSLMGIVMPAIVLGQIFLAKPVNKALDMVMPAALKIEKFIIGIYEKIFSRRKAEVAAEQTSVSTAVEFAAVAA